MVSLCQTVLAVLLFGVACQGLNVTQFCSTHAALNCLAPDDICEKLAMVDKLVDRVTKVERVAKAFLLEMADEDKRLELCGMGMKSGAIGNDSIYASSSFPPAVLHAPHFARLDEQDVIYGSWVAHHQSPGEYIEVDFGEEVTISGVITQGRPTLDQWVTAYTVSCGKEPTNETSDELITVQENGVDKVFQGNTDRNTKVVNLLPEVLTCRRIRITVVSFHWYIALRMEFIHGDCGVLYE